MCDTAVRSDATFTHPVACTIVLVDTLVLSISPWISISMFSIGEARVLN